jgi:hypothetical protein
VRPRGIPAPHAEGSEAGLATGLRATWAFSSGGKSARLITVRSVVRVHKGPRAGDVAQLGEHLLCTQGVGSSSLPVSTCAVCLPGMPKPDGARAAGDPHLHMRIQVCEILPAVSCGEARRILFILSGEHRACRSGRLGRERSLPLTRPPAAVRRWRVLIGRSSC